MVCPFCSHQSKTKVYNSRSTASHSRIWRRRKCLNCKSSFTTEEKIDFSKLIVKKQDGKHESFLFPKLFISVHKALEDPEASWHISNTVAESLHRQADKNLAGLTSVDIRTAVYDILARYDKPASIRYRSFYK